MSKKDLINYFFNQEEEDINENYYDPQDIPPDPNNGINDLREKFNIYKVLPSGEIQEDKICDGAGHYISCPYYLIEVTATDLQYSLRQIKSTLRHIYQEGKTVKKIAIILDINRWNDRMSSLIYKIHPLTKLLYKRKKNYNEKITIDFNGQTISFNIYCYLVDFLQYEIND